MLSRVVCITAAQTTQHSVDGQPYTYPGGRGAHGMLSWEKNGAERFLVKRFPLFPQHPCDSLPNVQGFLLRSTGQYNVASTPKQHPKVLFSINRSLHTLPHTSLLLSLPSWIQAFYQCLALLHPPPPTTTTAGWAFKGKRVTPAPPF